MADPAKPQKELLPSEKFFRYFQHELTDLQEQIERLEDHGTSGGERADAVDHCLAGIARLSNEVNDASSYLPAYDQRTYGEAVKALLSKLQAVRSVVAPKAKFAFKHGASFSVKKNASAISLTDAAEMADAKRRQIPGYVSDRSGDSSFATTPQHLQSPPNERAHDGSDAGRDDVDRRATTRPRLPSFSQSVTMDGHRGLHIILPPSAGQASSVGSLSNLEGCVLDMSPPTTRAGRPFATLTLKNISNSLIICGHVAGAAHLTNIQNSVIVVASRQFRMHESKNCHVYLSTSSRPIIEDCTALQFAPLPDKHATEADKLNGDQWQQVDDFKWLRNEPSPNWSILKEPLPSRVWSDVVPGGPGMSTDDVLKAVNIPRS